MRVVRGRPALNAARATLAAPVGLVPTMGALHAGHASLLRTARAETASLVASLFVNPTQFGPGEDFEHYPRDEASDLAAFEALGVDVVFAPTVDEIYPEGASTTVDPGPLGELLEGAARPGHFRGVATVVTVLFSLIRPERAYFGEKDAQQTVVVRRLVADLGLGVEIVTCPTVREPDGLALSSRNRYLSAAERAAAPVLWRALARAAEMHAGGGRDAERLREAMRATVAAQPLARLDYASVSDAATLRELTVIDGEALLSLAVRFPSARLIDALFLPGGFSVT